MKYSGNNQYAARGELVFITYLLSFLVYFCILFFQNQSLRHAVVFAGSILNYYIVFSRTSRHRSLSSFLSIIYIISIMIFGILMNYTGSLFEVVYSSLNFLSVYILLTDDSSFLITARLRRFTVYICIIISFITLLLTRSNVAYLMESGKQSKFLTLGFTNPNLTGIVLFGVFSLLLINLARKHIVVQLISLFSLLYLIYLTGSRSSFIAAIFVAVYYLFLSNRKLPDAVIPVVLIIPVVFPFVYLWLFRQFSDLTFLGKPFYSGRERMYNLFFEMLKINPTRLLFGDINIQFANAHNAPLAVLLTVGLIATIIVYFRIIKQIYIRNKYADTRISRTAIVALLGVFIQSSTEAYFMTGTFPGVILLFLISSLSIDRAERLGGRQ